MTANIGALTRFQIKRRILGLPPILLVVQLQRPLDKLGAPAGLVEPSVFQPDKLAEKLDLSRFGTAVDRLWNPTGAAVSIVVHRAP